MSDDEEERSLDEQIEAAVDEYFEHYADSPIERDRLIDATRQAADAVADITIQELGEAMHHPRVQVVYEDDVKVYAYNMFDEHDYLNITGICTSSYTRASVLDLAAGFIINLRAGSAYIDSIVQLYYAIAAHVEGDYEPPPPPAYTAPVPAPAYSEEPSRAS